MNSVYSIWNIFLFVLFGNCNFLNVVSTFTNVVKLELENDKVVSMFSDVVHVNVEILNIDSMLSDVVNSNVEMQNVVSTFIWRCPTSRRRINQKIMMLKCWNVCWVAKINRKVSLQDYIHLIPNKYWRFWAFKKTLFQVDSWIYIHMEMQIYCLKQLSKL